MQDPHPDPPPGGTAVPDALAILEARWRDPAGIIPCRWSEAAESPDCIDVNETFPLVLAWRQADPARARDIVRAALAGEQSGVLPRRFRFDGRPTDPGTPWPLLAQAALVAYRADPAGAGEFPRQVLPALQRALSCALDTFDPGCRGRPSWLSEEESYLPDAWAAGLQATDLCGFLLAEIEAFLALALETASPENPWSPETFADARRVLAEGLERELWSPEAHAFRDRMPDGQPVARETAAAFLPLLWPNLHTRFREALLVRLAQPGGLVTRRGIAAWEAWPDDPQAPPVRPVDQLLLLAALDPLDDTPPAVRIHMAIEAAGAASEGPFAPCLRAALSETLPGATGPMPWWERHWRRTVAAGISLVVGAVALSVWGLSARRGMPSSSVEALAGLARNRYLSGDLPEALRIYREVLDGTRDAPPALHAYYANALFRNSDFEKAEVHYRLALRGEGMDNPAIHFNLAQALHRMDRRDEARERFLYILEEFDDYPDILRSARLALAFMDDRERKRE